LCYDGNYPPRTNFWIFLVKILIKYSIYADIRLGLFKTPGQAFPEN